MHHQDEFSVALDPARHEESKWRFSEIASFALAGVTLGVAVAVTGHYLGKNANARAIDDGEWVRVVTPATTISEKSSPLLPPSALRNLAPDAGSEILVEPRVVRSGKADYLIKPVLRTARAEKASVTAQARERLITTPPVWKIEKSWRLARGKKQKILAERKRRLAQRLAKRKRMLREQACLATALYFEARSESERGQMAVAEVILNRVRSPKFPNTICGVVYQGAERRNSCQFSFACDGKSDIATQPKAWARARRIAARALKGKLGMRTLAGATYYHADYVAPRWARAMRRIAKIGRHIFYRGG